jgi:hypothetical protein
MADKQTPNSGQPQQINLNEVAQKFMSGLQRHFDLLAYNLAAHDTVQEEAYNKRVNASHIMPSSTYHQNFEQLQAYARDLLVRQIINDSLNLTLTAMNNAHFFLSLIKATDAIKQIDPEAQRKANASQQNFMRAKLDEKFNYLERDYAIMCALEDSIISLGFMLQILVKQNKVVQKAQLDNRGKLVVELKAVETPEGETPMIAQLEKLVDVRKVYREGDVISFDDVELQLILVTIASFADSLFKSVAGYARSVKKGA